MNPERMENRPLPTDSPTSDRTIVCGVCAFLAAITLVVFWQTWRFDFVNYDDDVFVYKNTIVIAGLTLKGIAAAFFSSTVSDNWIPLTTFSHILDWHMFGTNAAGHHL